MRILALETSAVAGSVAALAGDRLLATLDLDPVERSARSLAPAVRRLLSDIGWRPGDVELAAVTCGPGSFTGLRVGVTTAKTFAYAVGAKTVGVDTLEVIASQVPAGVQGDVVAAGIDAHRGEVFAAAFCRDPAGAVARLSPSAIVEQSVWLGSLPEGCLVSGPALEQLVDRVGPGRTCVEQPYWRPTAAAVGRLAWLKHTAGESSDPWQLAPFYLRASAAEERAAGAARGADDVTRR